MDNKHIQDALNAMDSVILAASKPKKKKAAKKKKPSVKKTSIGKKKVQTKAPKKAKIAQKDSAKKKQKPAAKKAVKKAVKKVQTKTPANKKAAQAKKAAKKKKPVAKKASTKIGSIPGARLKKGSSVASKQAKAKKRAKARATVSASAVTPKQLKGYIKAKKDAAWDAMGNTTHGDSYNKSKFGIDKATYKLINDAMFDMHGMYPPKKVSLAAINRHLSAGVEVSATPDGVWGRRDQSAPQTPWGRAQSAYNIAPGVTSYDTASHGGIEVRGPGLRQLSNAAKEHGDRHNGALWYEEDVMVNILFFERPEWFKSLARKAGIRKSLSRDDFRKQLEEWVPEYTAVSASMNSMVKAFSNKPNLMALNKVIKRGIISADEVVSAIEEALLVKRMNRRLAMTIADSLREVFDIGDVVDVGQASLAASSGDIQAPEINMNGSKGKELVKQLREAYGDAADLEKSLRKSTPHPRDYQTLPPEAFRKAQKQYEDRANRVSSVKDELTEIALIIQKQTR